MYFLHVYISWSNFLKSSLISSMFIWKVDFWFRALFCTSFFLLPPFWWCFRYCAISGSQESLSVWSLSVKASCLSYASILITTPTLAIHSYSTFYNNMSIIECTCSWNWTIEKVWCLSLGFLCILRAHSRQRVVWQVKHTNMALGGPLSSDFSFD
mgnify:CR=1 FL=1